MSMHQRTRVLGTSARGDMTQAMQLHELPRSSRLSPSWLGSSSGSGQSCPTLATMAAMKRFRLWAVGAILLVAVPLVTLFSGCAGAAPSAGAPSASSGAAGTGAAAEGTVTSFDCGNLSRTAPFPIADTTKVPQYQLKVLAAALQEELARVFGKNRTAVELAGENGERLAIGVPKEAIKMVSACVKPLFSDNTQVTIDRHIKRGLASVNILYADDLRPALLKSGMIDIGAVWAVLVKTFPGSCGAELDASSMKVVGLSREVASNAHELPPAPGFQYKIRRVVTLKLADGTADQSSSTPGETAVLKLVDTIHWRPASDSKWRGVGSEDALSKGMLSTTVTKISDCKRGLLQSIVVKE